MNLKILYCSSIYEELIQSFKNRNANLDELNYERHKEKFKNFSRGQEFSYTYYLKKVGYDVNLVYLNYNDLQKKWSKENNLKFENNLKIFEKQINEFKPEIIYFQNIFILDKVFFLEIKKKFPFVKRLISWVCSPYNFNQFEIIKNSDVVFTCNKGFLKSLFNLNKNSFQVNHAFDKRNALIDINKSIDVSFIGSIVCNKNFHLNRFETLFYLSKNLPEMKIFSKLYYKLNFKNLINLKRLLKAYYLSKRLKKPVFGEDYYYNLHKSKIVLNSHLDLDEYSGNMRLFEATGSESLVITNFSEDLNDYFNDDEIVSYHNKNDALEKIKYFINNPQERRRIAANGKKRVLKSFSYEVRIKDINKIILENF